VKKEVACIICGQLLTRTSSQRTQLPFCGPKCQQLARRRTPKDRVLTALALPKLCACGVVLSKPWYERCRECWRKEALRT
jgi:hypothetical protein